MDWAQTLVLLGCFTLGLWHHGKSSYNRGRAEAAEDAVEMVVRILQKEGIITIDEKEDIFRNEKS